MAGLRRKLGKSASSANVETSKTGGSSDYIPYLKKHGVGTFKPKNTHYEIDVLPYVVTDKNHPDKVKPGDWAVSRNILIHTNIGANKRKLLCPKMKGKHCPICVIADGLWKEAKSEEEKKAAAAKSSKKRTIYVLKVEGEEELKVWDVAYGFFTELLLEEIKEDEKFVEYACADEGYTIKLRLAEKEWSGFKYMEPSKVTFKDTPRRIEDSYLEKVPKIDDFLDFLSEDEVEAILYDLAPPEKEEVVEEEVENKPPKRSSVKAKEVVEDKDIDPQEDEQVKEQAKADKKAKRAKAKADKEAAEKKAKEEESTSSDLEEGTCPSGHIWAEDVDEKKDCDSCPLHDACDKAFEEME